MTGQEVSGLITVNDRVRELAVIVCCPNAQAAAQNLCGCGGGAVVELRKIRDEADRDIA